MKPAPFDYLRAGTVAEATDALAELGDEARILAGGQSLVAMLNMRLVEPALVIDIGLAAGLNHLARKGNAIEIGAAVTQARLERWPELAAAQPLLAKALPHVGHFQTRNKGTVCGSIAHADPSSELPLCLALLDGEVRLARRRGRRAVGARAYFTGLMQTARQPDELIEAVTFPCARPGEGYAFEELAIRHGDFAIVAIAAKATATGISIGVAGAAETPQLRDWPALEGSALDDALNALAWEITTQEDVHATRAYRRRLIRTLGRRTIEEARRCRA
jgi:2-furoyl-CoA dehydrogenase FAD binding subunit